MFFYKSEKVEVIHMGLTLILLAWGFRLGRSAQKKAKLDRLANQRPATEEATQVEGRHVRHAFLT
jgi:hypothetical protein